MQSLGVQQTQPTLPPVTNHQEEVQAEPLPGVGRVESAHQVVTECQDDISETTVCAEMDWKAEVKRLRQLLDSEEIELQELCLHKRGSCQNITERRALLRKYMKSKEMHMKALNVKEAQMIILQAMLRAQLPQ